MDTLTDFDARFATTTQLIAAARRRLSPEAWDYLCGGSETETTISRNRQALDSIAFRPRVMRQVADTDLTTSFLGVQQRLPVFLAPIAAMSQFDPQGALSAARAAADFGCFFMMSIFELEERELTAVAEAAREQFLFQLYVQGDERWGRRHGPAGGGRGMQGIVCHGGYRLPQPSREEPLEPAFYSRPSSRGDTKGR